MSKIQQRMRERDPTYITETNILTIVEFSHVCPFKCRHNHLICFYCGENFSDPQLLRDHTASSHHPKKFKITDHKNMLKVDLTRIDCRLCPQTINTLEDFKKHITSVHDKKYYFNTRDMILPFRLTKHEYKCALCEAVFPYFHALNKHMNEHYSNFVCETCGLGWFICFFVSITRMTKLFCYSPLPENNHGQICSPSQAMHRPPSHSGTKAKQ